MNNSNGRVLCGCSLMRSLSISIFAMAILTSPATAEELAGDWSLELESGLPAWMSVRESEGKPLVYLRLYVGSAGPYNNIEVSNGRLKFVLRKKKAKKTTVVDVGMKAGKLDGMITRQSPDGSVEREAFTGKKIPSMPAKAPDLGKVRFGQPILLFNGKDLSGWRPHKPKHEPEKKNGWSVEDGLLKNTTPKTDFSATGAYANLETEAVFEDFWLHADCLLYTSDAADE